MENNNSLRVIVAGGAGFLGQCVAREIASRGALLDGTPVTEIILADIAAPTWLESSSLIRVAIGDVSDRVFVDSLFDGAPGRVSCFWLCAIMSGGGEKDFDLCMRVNLHGFLNCMEAARNCAAAPCRVVFSSTAATMGAGAPSDFITPSTRIDDSMRRTPHSTYGTTKSCCELLLSDYSRRGFVDGRAGRLATVIVRAGAPNAATTSCFSGIIREPLAGVDCVMPIAANVKHGVGSSRMVVRALLTLHELPRATVDRELGFDRSVFLPCTPLSLADLAAALKRVVAEESWPKLGAIAFAPDSFLSNVIASCPTYVDWSRARRLGVAPDVDAEEMIREYVEDFGPDALGDGIVLRPRREAGAGGAGSSAAATSAPAKVALITGGGSGIGAAVAHAIAAEWGSSVAIVLAGRREEPLLEVCASCVRLGAGATLAVAADISRPYDVAELFATIEARFGRLDLLFNNAGIGAPSIAMEELDVATWQKVVSVNLSGAFYCTAKAMALMKAPRRGEKGGRIINNGSVSAQTPRPFSAPYTATKHALTGLTKSTALDGRAHGVACGQIDIGNARSAMTARQEAGALQASGERAAESCIDVKNVASAFMCMANLPLSANVLSMTVMATTMPLVGRG